MTLVIFAVGWLAQRLNTVRNHARWFWSYRPVRSTHTHIQIYLTHTNKDDVRGWGISNEYSQHVPYTTLTVWHDFDSLLRRDIIKNIHNLTVSYLDIFWTSHYLSSTFKYVPLNEQPYINTQSHEWTSSFLSLPNMGWGDWLLANSSRNSKWRSKTTWRSV